MEKIEELIKICDSLREVSSIFESTSDKISNILDLIESKIESYELGGTRETICMLLKENLRLKLYDIFQIPRFADPKEMEIYKEALEFATREAIKIVMNENSLPTYCSINKVDCPYCNGTGKHSNIDLNPLKRLKSED